jgi:hypothetical protein
MREYLPSREVSKKIYICDLRLMLTCFNSLVPGIQSYIIRVQEDYQDVDVADGVLGFLSSIATQKNHGTIQTSAARDVFRAVLDTLIPDFYLLECEEDIDCRDLAYDCLSPKKGI